MLSMKPRADSTCWFAPSQWETVLLCNDVSHWLGAIVESALKPVVMEGVLRMHFDALHLVHYCLLCLIDWCCMVMRRCIMPNTTLCSWQFNNVWLIYHFILGKISSVFLSHLHIFRSIFLSYFHFIHTKGSCCGILGSWLSIISSRHRNDL